MTNHFDDLPESAEVLPRREGDTVDRSGDGAPIVEPEDGYITVRPSPVFLAVIRRRQAEVALSEELSGMMQEGLDNTD